MSRAAPHPFAAYLPKLTERGGEAGGPPAATPYRESVFSAVLFADLVGFTARTASLEAGRNGAEKIGRLLNAHLRPLVRACETHGGDIVKFAGDALLVCWPIDEGDDDGVRQAILAAASCALAMQDAIRALDARHGGAALKLRVGLAAGPVRILHLGTHAQRRVLLVSGDGIDRATRGGSLAEPGEVRIGRLAHQLVGEEVQVDWSGERSVLEAITPLDPFEPPPPPARHWHPAFADYLSATVRARLDDGARGWMTETRVVSVLFVHLPDLTFGTDPAVMNHLLATTHEAVARQGGVTNKISVDEKGATLLAVFGLPPRVHEDNATRACRSALAIQGALAQTGHTVSMGITTGRAFCGEIGGEARREYTVIGDTVNTAARLMQASPGSVSIDRRTARQATPAIQLEPLAPAHLKGKAAPVERFRPTGAAPVAPAHSLRPIGRGPLLRSLAAQATEAHQSGAARVSLVVGPAGIGKSAVGLAAVEAWTQQGVRVARAQGDGLATGRRGTPLRALLQHLYGSGPTPREMHRVQVALRTAAGPDAAALGQVEGLLPVPLPSAAASPTRPDRAVQVDLMVRLLLEGIGSEPTVFFIEDAHWLDAFTLSVLERLASAPRPLFLFLTARPPPDASASTWAALRRLARPLRLPALSRKNTRALLARRLEVRTVPAELGELVFARSGGNPLFIIHLADHLCETGAVDVHQHELAVRADPMIRWQAGLPMTIESLLLARVDRLQRDAQFTLKVASIFGERFDRAALRATHPLSPPEAELTAALDELQRQEIIAPTAQADEWRFRHILIRDAVYEILSTRQRKALHDAAAQHLASVEPVVWFDVGEHARKALRDADALEAYSRAAADAAGLGAQEAAARLQTVLPDLLRRTPASPLQIARLAMAESVLHESAGDLSTARACLDHAIEKLTQTDGAAESRTPEHAAAHLLNARLHRVGGLYDAAIHHAKAAQRLLVADSARLAQAVALEVTSTWLAQGTPVAARALRSHAGREAWSLRMLDTLVDAAAARSDVALHSAIEEAEASLENVESRQCPAEDRRLFTRATVGLLLMAGAPDRARVLLTSSTGALSPLDADLVALTTLLEGRPPELLLPKERAALPPIARALVCWGMGEPVEIPRLTPRSLGTSMAAWPQLMGAVLLAEAHPHHWTPESITTLDDALQQAARHTPSARSAFAHLRGRLARCRGQRVRGWMMQAWTGGRPDQQGWFGVHATLPPRGSGAGAVPSTRATDVGEALQTPSPDGRTSRQRRAGQR